MMQKQRYCRQRIDVLSDKQCKFGLYRVRFEHIVQGASKISYDSLLNLKKVTAMKESHSKESLYICFYSKKEISEFCKSDTVKVYKQKFL